MAAPLPIDPRPSNAARETSGHGRPLLDLPQQHDRACAVAAIGLEVCGELLGQLVLVDLTVLTDMRDQHAGHLGVVGPGPRRRWKGPLHQRIDTGPGDEELGAQRIADRKPVQAVGAQIQPHDCIIVSHHGAADKQTP
jgi:hypothetical protein